MSRRPAIAEPSDITKGDLRRDNGNALAPSETATTNRTPRPGGGTGYCGTLPRRYLTAAELVGKLLDAPAGAAVRVLVDGKVRAVSKLRWRNESGQRGAPGPAGQFLEMRLSDVR